MQNLLKMFATRPGPAPTAPAPVMAAVPPEAPPLPSWTPRSNVAVAMPAGVVKTDGAAASVDAVTPVLDALGAMLQCWARHPVLLSGEERGEAERTVMDWQRHATIGTPIPGVHAPDAVAGPVHGRDWAALVSLTSARRRAESMTVGEHMGDLQRVVWDTVASLARVAGDDVSTDKHVNQQLAMLRASAQRGDPAAVMKDLPAALSVITEALAARQTRAARERTMMAERVESWAGRCPTRRTVRAPIPSPAPATGSATARRVSARWR